MSLRVQDVAQVALFGGIALGCGVVGAVQLTEGNTMPGLALLAGPIGFAAIGGTELTSRRLRAEDEQLDVE